MLNAITIIVLFQLAGEALAMLTGIPVPGSVLGMVFLLLAFFVKDDLIDLIRPTGGVLLSNLSLLFVPASSDTSRALKRKASALP
jgi:holin-like protein